MIRHNDATMRSIWPCRRSFVETGAPRLSACPRFWAWPAASRAAPAA